MKNAFLLKAIFIFLIALLSFGCSSEISREQRMDSREIFIGISNTTAAVVLEKNKFEKIFEKYNATSQKSKNKKRARVVADAYFAKAEQELVRARELRTEARELLEFSESSSSKNFDILIEEIKLCINKSREFSKTPSELYNTNEL